MESFKSVLIYIAAIKDLTFMTSSLHHPLHNRLLHRLLLPASLALIGLVLFWPSFTHPFVWDDEEQIVANQAITSLDNVPRFFLGSTFNSGGTEGLTGLYYKPLLTTSFALLYAVFGLEPAGYHVAQVLLHIGNALLLYVLLVRVWRRREAAALLSLLFLIHPVQVESVVYIAGLQEPLFMFFGLLALLAIQRWWLMGPLLLLSLLSKETGIVFALLAPLYAFLLTGKKRLITTLTSITTVGLYLGLRFGVARLPILEHNLTPINRLSLLERIPNIPKIISNYLGDLLWPQQLSISEHWVIGGLNWADFYLPLLLCTLAAAIVFGLWRFQAAEPKESAFFALWFVLALGLHLHLVPLDFTTSDRWLYLPLVGFFAFLISLLPRKKPLLQYPQWQLFALALYLVLLMLRSILRIDNWQSGLTLYRHDIALSPESFDLNNNLGVELHRHNYVEQAQQYFLRSTKLAPYWWTNWNNLGVTLEAEGNLQAAGEAYLLAIENGEYYLAYQNYARLLIKAGKTQEAKTFLESAIEKFPNNSNLQALANHLY